MNCQKSLRVEKLVEIPSYEPTNRVTTGTRIQTTVSDLLTHSDSFFKWRRKMKTDFNVWINDEAEELLMNLVAQGYYGVAWELKIKLLIAFEDSLDYILYNTINEELGDKK